MNKLTTDTRAIVLRCLTDGMSIRATCRTTGASKGAVLRFLEEAGTFAATYQHHVLVNLPTIRVEADEIWSFCGAEQKNATQEGHGDLWTYAAIDAESKLVISWLVGARSGANCDLFVADMASRLGNRIQLSTDAAHAYLTAIRKSFKFATVDYGQILKTYAMAQEKGANHRHSPQVCTGCTKRRVVGRPDMALVSTSYIERLNLDIRQNCRRFTRLTNGHSKLAVNHAHAVALNFLKHNFLKVHSTLSKASGVKTTPAMASGLTDHV